MSRPWLAEHAVDAQTAARLIAEQMPELAGLPVLPLAEGWDNTAFTVDGRLVFRFPRRQVAIALLENEISLLPRFASRLPVPIPTPVFVGAPSAGFPAPFAGYARVEGTTGCAHEFEGAQLAQLGADLGHFLKALHSTPHALVPDAPSDRFHKTDYVSGLASARDRARQLLAGPHAAVARLFEAQIDALMGDGHLRGAAAEALCLVHGDLYGRHVLVDDAGRLSGVIDWGDCLWSERALDLSFTFSFLDEAARAAFFAVYGQVHPATLARARARALVSATAVLAYGQDVDDKGMIGLGLWAARCLGGQR